MEVIDKAAFVAKIEKRIKETESMQPKFDQFWAGQISAFKGVLKILDTLEVKEVDLEKESEKELAELYINIFDKKFGNKLPKLKCTQLAEFKNFINTCEQIFRIKYFGYHATQGKLFEKFALLWAVWGKEHLLSTEIKEVDFEKELGKYLDANDIEFSHQIKLLDFAKHFFELGLNARKGE